MNYSRLINFVLQKRIMAHLISWVVFILYETIAAKIVVGISMNIVAFAHYLFTIALFYLFSNFVLPITNKSHFKILKGIFGVAVYLSFFIFGHFFIDNAFIYFEISEIQEMLGLNLKYFTGNLFIAIYFMGFSTAYYYLNTYNGEKKKSELLEKQRLNDITQQQRMEQELLNAENAFLKAQINPHFLFNTLDFIYHQVHDSSPEAGDAIIDLSNMMRYAMDAGRNGGVEVLGKEIEQVETLIHLYQIRKRGKYCIEFHATDEVKELYLIPLVLLTLVENVFKHGELLDEENPASIRLWVAEGQLHICTNNGLLASNYTGKSGHGLLNTANRLHSAYGEQAILKSEQVNGNFLVQLSVPVDLLHRPAPPGLSSIKIDKE